VKLFWDIEMEMKRRDTSKGETLQFTFFGKLKNSQEED
jgi:hypothetical protein